MSDPIQIEQEIRDFVETQNDVIRSDFVPNLMKIVNKHLAEENIEHMIVYDDLAKIFDRAKGMYAGATWPTLISGREIKEIEFIYILVMESFTGHLKKNNLLKRLVKFDYRRKNGTN